MPFLDYDVEIRKVICTTNAIESLNAPLPARGPGAWPLPHRAGGADSTGVEVLHEAETAYVELEAHERKQDAYGYTSAQLHFYRSNALTTIGATAEAYEAQCSALEVYPAGTYLDTSLVRLDQARCLLLDNEPEEAARLTCRVIADLPQEHQSPIVIDSARTFHAAIPNPLRSLPDVNHLKDLLAIGPGAE